MSPLGRPRNPNALVPVEIGLEPMAIRYLDALIGKGGFGGSRPEVVRGFVWKEIHRLIEVNRLNEIP